MNVISPKLTSIYNWRTDRPMPSAAQNTADVNRAMTINKTAQKCLIEAKDAASSAAEKLRIAQERQKRDQFMRDHLTKILTYIPIKDEAEAVCVYLFSDGYKKNTMLALQVINRFAQENKIRFEDVCVVLSE